MKAHGPTPATMIACVALFVALGGSSYAALRVDSAQIADNGVRSRDLRDNGVRSRDLRDNGVRSRDLRDSGVRSRDVRDGSLRAGDFAPGQLPAGAAGPQGPRGPQGARGPQGLRGPTGAKGEPGAAATTMWAYVGALGTLRRGSGVAKTARFGAGVYGITFDHEIDTCVLTPAAMEDHPGYNAASSLVAHAADDPGVVYVYIWNSALNSYQDRSFSLLVTC